MTTEKIIIIGAKGYGQEILWTINDCNKIEKKYEVIGFIDDDKNIQEKRTIDGIKILGGIDWFSRNIPIDYKFIIAIGDSLIRKKVSDQISKYDVEYATIIHPSVISSSSIAIGNGSIIQAGCILTVNIKLGNHVHVNIDSTIGHNCFLDDFVTINPGVHVNGNTRIHEGAYIGSGTSMKHEIAIGAWSTVGAGTVLINDVPEKSLFVGVPGKKIR